MYIPQEFLVTNEAALESFMRQYAFATIISASAQGLVSTHAPVSVRREVGGLVIAGHVARENPHLHSMTGEGGESLIIFHGPHSYVSPTWYENAPAVPTWNYAAVHAYGFLRSRSEADFIRAVLTELVERYEGNSSTWRIERLPHDYYLRMSSRIVGFEMPVERLEGKFKLGQNRAVEDRLGTIKALESTKSEAALELARLMREYLKTPSGE